MTDRPSDSASPKAGSDRRIVAAVADDFQPDIPHRSPSRHRRCAAARRDQRRTVGRSRPRTDAFGAADPLAFDAPHQPAAEPSRGTTTSTWSPAPASPAAATGCWSSTAAPPPLQFWQALDTALDRQVALTFVDPDGRPARRRATGDPVPHPAAQPHRQARYRPRARRRAHRLRRPGGLRVDPRRLAAGGRRHRTVSRRRRRGPCSRWPPPPRPPTAPASRCRSTTPAGCGSASKATSCWPTRRPCPTPARRTTSAASAPRCTPCWSTGGHCRSPGCAAGWRRHSAIRPAIPSNPLSIDRDIPFQISAVAVRSVQEDGGIRSASTLLNLLQQATAVADRTEVLGPIDDPDPPAPRRGRAGSAQPSWRTRRRAPSAPRLTIGVGAGAAVIVVALLVLASVVSKIFGDVGWPQQRPARPERPVVDDARAPAPVRRPRAASSNPSRPPSSPPAAKPTTRARPGRRSTAIPAPPGRPTSTTTPFRSPASRTASG